MSRNFSESLTWALSAIALAFSLGAAAESVDRAQRETIGPANGSLVIVGGAMHDPAIRAEFIRLAGGPRAPIVVIPTAGGGEDYNALNSGLREWRDAGVTDVQMLHTTSRKNADTESFVFPLRRAKGVWLNGGRQWRLADAYLGTMVEEALWEVLDRGGVIGGSSAGATIQGSYLARGDSRTNTVMMGDHEKGFGFIKDSAIDQHVLRRNRHFDLLEIIEKKPELLGIGIDENAALVVEGDHARVIGQSYVAIYDAYRRVNGGPGGAGGPFYFLSPGDTLNLRTREPKRSMLTPWTLDRVVEVERENVE